MDNYDEKLDELVKDFKENFKKFSNGNKVAATRARKNLQDMKNLAHEARQVIQEKKNSM